MKWLVVLATGLAAAGVARAEEPSLAGSHARDSTTVYLATTWAPGPTVPIRGGIDAALRLARSRLVLEVRLGGGAAASVLGLGEHVTGHAGTSLGGAVSVGNRLMITPMLAYDVFTERESTGATVWVHTGALALPVSVVLERGVILELLVQAGFARYLGATDPAIVVGPRFGVVL